MNKVMLCGNLGGDPEIKYTPSGTAICSFSIATSERWKDKQTGEQQERTEWHRCTAFGRGGEVISEYLKKGDKLLVTDGQIRYEEYEKEGQKRWATKIIVRGFEFVGSKKGGDDREEGHAGPRQAGKPASQAPADTFEDDDIPF